MELRHYQEQAITAILEARERKVTRQLLVLATGLGKTVIIAGLLKRLGFPKTFGFMHRDELIEQSIKKIRAFDSDVKIGVEKAQSRVDLEQDTIALASVQTVGRRDKKRISRFAPDWPSLLWVDEAHHAPAESYKVVLDHFGVHGLEPKRDRLLVGTTATPDRLDGKMYDKLFDDVVYRYGLREGIQDKFLADILAYRMDADLDLSKVKIRHGDFVEKDLAKAIVRSNLDEMAVKSWKEKCLGKKSLVFCVDKAHAERFLGLITKNGARGDMIVDTTKKNDRTEILRKFETGDLDVLVNVGVLTEGFDCPTIQCVHVLRPTKSKTIYTQMIGRGTRRIPGVKEQVEVFDYTQQVHNVVSIGRIFGLPEEWKMKGQSLLGDTQQMEMIEAELGVKVDQAESIEDIFAKLKSKRLRLLINEITDSGLASDLAWLRPSKTEERWVLNWRNEVEDTYSRETNQRTVKKLIKGRLIGASEWIEVEKNELGHFEAKWKATGPAGTRAQKIATNPSCLKLVGEVEAMIKQGRSHQWNRLLKNAAWRRSQAPPEDKQKLAVQGVPEWILPNLSRGDSYSLLQLTPGTIEMMFKSVEKPPQLMLDLKVEEKV